MWDDFIIWLESFNFIQNIMAIMIIGGFLIFFIEVIISAFGGTFDGNSVDGFVDDLGSSDYAFKFFSLFSLSVFLFVGGCFGLWSYTFVNNDVIAILVAIISGIIAFTIIHKLRKIILKLQSDGNIHMDLGVGKTAIVYLSIPVDGKGQIEIDLQGRKKIMPAISVDNNLISTGTRVVVKDISNSTFVVEKI